MVLIINIGAVMVKNPLSPENQDTIRVLIKRCSELITHASEESQGKIEDIFFKALCELIAI